MLSFSVIALDPTCARDAFCAGVMEGLIKTQKNWKTFASTPLNIFKYILLEGGSRSHLCHRSRGDYSGNGGDGQPADLVAGRHSLGRDGTRLDPSLLGPSLYPRLRTLFERILFATTTIKHKINNIVFLFEITI